MNRLNTISNHFSPQETVIVVGVGTMGSATCAELAQRGSRVIGLERFTIGNEQGSHTGQSRSFRLAYDVHNDYVPLLKRARELWLELNKKTGK
jgi:sarcosine oxidase